MSGYIQSSRASLKTATQDIAAQFGIQELLPKQFSSLSGGQKRKVLNARAMVNNPDILLLDEPLAGLDVESQERLKQDLSLLKHSGKTTIVHVTHRGEFVRDLADRIICIDRQHLNCNDFDEHAHHEHTLTNH